MLAAASAAKKSEALDIRLTCSETVVEEKRCERALPTGFPWWRSIVPTGVFALARAPSAGAALRPPLFQAMRGLPFSGIEGTARAGRRVPRRRGLVNDRESRPAEGARRGIYKKARNKSRHLR